MPTVLQFRRGTTAQNNSFTGSSGELSIDTDLEIIRVHDGSVPGGFALIGANAVQTMTNKTLTSPAISSATFSGTSTGTANLNITGFVTATGNITGGNLITDGLVSLSSITKTGSNGVGNIGAAASTFNTIFAKATSAQYADLAELYTADSAHVPGTVLIFGGSAEVTESTQSHSTRIAGVVSTNPAHVMNSALTAANTAVVALMGRAPCRVVGAIQPGDCLVSSHIPGTATVLDAARYQPGCVIGKALAPYNSTEPGTIEVVVGRL